MIETKSKTYHIVIGRAAEQYDYVKEDAVRGDTTWTINMLAKKGDVVLFYITAPVSAIVATGVAVNDAKRSADPESDWNGFFMCDIIELELLERPLTRETIRREIPSYGYMYSPIKSSRIPERHVPQIERLLRSHSSE